MGGEGCVSPLCGRVSLSLTPSMGLPCGDGAVLRACSVMSESCWMVTVKSSISSCGKISISFERGWTLSVWHVYVLLREGFVDIMDRRRGCSGSVMAVMKNRSSSSSYYALSAD